MAGAEGGEGLATAGGPEASRPRPEYLAPSVKGGMQRRIGPGGKIEKAHDPRGALRRLAAYLRPQAFAIALSMIFVALSSLSGLAGPYLMGLAIDGFVARGDLAGLGRVAVLMALAYALTNAFIALANWLMSTVSQSALRRLRSELFTKVQSLPISYFDSTPAGALMSRLTSDVEALNQAVSQNVTALLASCLGMLGILVAMFALNHWLALASLLVLPIMFGFTRFVGSRTRSLFRGLQAAQGELNAISEEAVSARRVIWAFRRKDSVLRGFEAGNQSLYGLSVKANSVAMLLMPFTQVLGNFFVVVVASLGGVLALAHLVSVGTIAAFVNYGQGFTQPLRQLANLYNSLQSALAGAERVFELLDEPGEEAASLANGALRAGAGEAARPVSTGSNLTDGSNLMDGSRLTDGPRPAVRSASDRERDRILGQVRFEGVDFSYRPGRPILKGFELEAESGKTLALVGPTGAGKTTVVNLLTRFYDVDGGRILIDGTDIRLLPRDWLRRQLALVLQESFLFSDTVMENIRYGRLEASDEECREAAMMAEADHFIRQLPEGYRTRLAERAANLSQGQRQLLAISRAILAKPAILILDEATSSVDTRTEARIQAGLLRLMSGRTSLVIAHRLSTIRQADRIALIRDGRVAELGTHQELLSQGGHYQRLYMGQFKGQQL